LKKSEWEALCSNCGLCCHEKVVSGDFLLIDTSAPCSFYDAKSKRCKVYSERFEKCSRCRKVTPFKAAFADYLPSSCAYVCWAKSHHLRFRREKEVVIGSGLFG